MSIYNQNLKILSSRFPHLAEILNEADTSAVSVQPAHRSGFTLLSRDGITFHSRVDPIKEADDFVRSKGIGGGGRWIVFGFGLGYHLQSATVAPGGVDELISVELCPEIVKAALETVDLTDLMEWHGFQLWVPGGIPSLEQRIVDLTNDVRVAVHPPSLALWLRRGLPVADLLERMELRRMNEQYSGASYQDALQRNKIILDKCQDAESYFGMPQNRAMMVIGAGPSFDQVRPLIKTYRSSVFILAVNAAFIPLRDAGIRPDVVVCVEPRSAAIASFDGNGEENIPLIFVQGTNAQVVENWKGPKLLAYGKNSKPLPHTGTVAGTALDVAIRLGGNPIILTGLDLALSESWYAKGVVKSPEETEGKITAASNQSIQTSIPKTFNVTGVDGNVVPTTRAFRYFIQSLECLIEDARLIHPNLKIFDLKSRGALIRGTMPIVPSKSSLETILGIRFVPRKPKELGKESLPGGVHS